MRSVGEVAMCAARAETCDGAAMMIMRKMMRVPMPGAGEEVVVGAARRPRLCSPPSSLRMRVVRTMVLSAGRDACIVRAIAPLLRGWWWCVARRRRPATVMAMVRTAAAVAEDVSDMFV